MSKGKSEVSSKVKCHGLYLGWKESAFPYGAEITDPVIREMIVRSQENPDALPRLKISVDKKEMKVSQLVIGKRGKKEKIRFPTIATKDLLFVALGSFPNENAVACVFYGYQPLTQSFLHIHVYQFETMKTATAFQRHMYQFTNTPQHRDRMEKLERELLEVVTGGVGSLPATLQSPEGGVMTGHIEPIGYCGSKRPTDYAGLPRVQLPSASESTSPRPQSDVPESPEIFAENRTSTSSAQDRSSGHSSTPPPDWSADPDGTPVAVEIPKEVPIMMCLAGELRSKLGKGPILLPPKDYDTVNRTRGCLIGIETRKCLNEDIVGKVDRPYSSSTSQGEDLLT